MGELLYSASQVVCPTCGGTFENNKVNALVLLQTINNIDARKRMYCKLSLDDLERLNNSKGSITFPEAKKIVLDSFNDFVRDIQTIMGLGADAE